MGRVAAIRLGNGTYELKNVAGALKKGCSVSKDGGIVYKIADIEGRVNDVDGAEILTAYTSALSSLRGGIEKIVTGTTPLDKALANLDNIEDPETKRLSKNVLDRLARFKRKAIY